MSAANLLPFPGALEALPRKRFTRDEVEIMMAAGMFEGQRWELIDGELIEFNNTEKMFTKPDKQMTEDYITGRFG